MRYSKLVRMAALGFVAACLASAASALNLPAVIGDNMVLQQGQPVPIWGWADKREEVTVTIAGQTAAAKVGDDGLWKVVLKELKPGDPLEMTVKSSSGKTITEMFSRTQGGQQANAVEKADGKTPIQMAIKPYAWWTFEKGKETDRMERFPVNNLSGGAKIEGGRLVLESDSATLVAARRSLVAAQPKFETPAMPPLNYHAEGMYHWDTWFMPLGDWMHMFHLQVKRPGSQRSNEDHEAIGHAVSKDLIHWQEQPVALRKGPPGVYDDGCLFTAYAVEHEGTIYLYYCSNHNQNGRGRQAICLATSKDGGQTYEKYAGNPIIEPDPKRYYAISEPPPPFGHHAHPHIDCRDLAIVKDPAGGGWLGYVVMRRKGQQDAFHSACIALCRSKDLVHWEVGDPACTPNRFNCFEVPDVFKLGDKWYMIALTGDAYGQSQRWSDPEITCATVVFQADRPEGPFEEVKDNLLLASKKNVWQGFSARTALRDGQRLMFFTRCEGINGRGRLSWPVKLVPRKEGGLDPMYWPGIESAFGPAMALARDGKPTSDAAFMATATVELKDAKAAGIAFGNYLALLDSTGKVSLANAAESKPVQDRRWPISPAGAYTLRLVVVNSMVDVYVDDVLVMDYYLAELGTGRVSLVSREGTGRFVGASYRALKASGSAAAGGGSADAAGLRLGNMKANKILFLGNSITLTRHDAIWKLDCGVAASAPEKDFAHLVTRYIAEANGGRAPAMKADNFWYVGQYEQRYANYDPEVSLREYLDWQPDILVIAIGENIENLDTPAKEAAFAKSFKGILTAFKNKSRPAIFVRGRFMGRNSVQDGIMRRCCEETGAVFVSMDTPALGGDPRNYAGAEKEITGYRDGAILAHPGDRGMKAIADALFEAMKARGSSNIATANPVATAARTPEADVGKPPTLPTVPSLPPVSAEAVRAARRVREQFLADPYRPGYHFCVPEDVAEQGAFDPNGAFYHNGRYHLMYLYNRNGAIFGPPFGPSAVQASTDAGCSWGHVSSQDLVHWRHHPDAIGPGHGDEGCFSGGAFVDDDGTAYLSYWMVWGARGIGIAKSSGSGTFDSWEKLAANPVIRSTEWGLTEAKDKNGKTFYYGSADPSNIWKKDGRYYMLTGNLLVLWKTQRAPDPPLSEQGDRAYLFASDNLKDWKYQHVFYERKGTDPREDNMCPSFLPLPSSAEGGKPSGKHLLLFISHTDGCQYYVGDYRNDRFHPDNHGRMSKVDTEFFAPEALVDGQGRQIMWAWLADTPPGGKKLRGWAGVYGLPRSLWLGEDGTLRMQPVKELQMLRSHEKSWNAMTLADGQTKTLEGVVGNSCEIAIDVEMGTAPRCGLKVLASGDGKEETLLYYDTNAKELCLDATRSGAEGRKVVEHLPLELKPGEPLKLRVFVDKSVVEIYANDRQAICRMVYPSRSDSLGVALFVNGGQAKFNSVKAWEMAPSNPY